MNINSIKETCIYVSDLERTRVFYEGRLGLPVIGVVPGRHIFFRAGSSVLLCFIAAETLQEAELPPHGASGSIHFAFEVTDYEASLQQLEEAGITILHRQLWKNGRRSAYFQDPDGHLLELVEPGLWER